MPAPTVNSALQADTSKAPKGVGRWDRADKPPATFLLSPAAERSRAVDNAETEWADALQRAREAKAQLARAQAAYDQAVVMEKLKFKAYSQARERFDE
ncbi:hypothetical protein FRC01_014168 [Tulasnella sp. 417]|nr:hypothetical protein FRC01_014168 [Tulasnella sp. 417]